MKISLGEKIQLPNLLEPEINLNINVSANIEVNKYKDIEDANVCIKFSGLFTAAYSFTFPCNSLKQAQAAGEIVASYLTLFAGDAATEESFNSIVLTNERAEISLFIYPDDLCVDNASVNVCLSPVDTPQEAVKRATAIIKKATTDLFNARDGITVHAVNTYRETAKSPKVVLTAIACLR